ncbi:MAG TPA: hypothetical protein DCO65_02965, partial [Spartobacteria bacterium]|nr:hypothetical protein [Spartobacteria bacterium]
MPVPIAKSEKRFSPSASISFEKRCVRAKSPHCERSTGYPAALPPPARLPLARIDARARGMEHSDMPPLTYANYLDLEKLLTLQNPRSTPAEHDEMLFIIIHQTYELWFKQLLHEFEKIKSDFSAGDLFGAIHSFKRTRTIMKTLVAQVDILETMTPSSFSSFRDRLETASGFQSIQFRELEFLLGYKRASTLAYVKPDFPGYDRLQQRLGERTVIDHFYDFLATRGAQIPADLKNRDLSQPNGPDERVQKEILRLYKSSPEVSILFELMTDFDEG